MNKENLNKIINFLETIIEDLGEVSGQLMPGEAANLVETITFDVGSLYNYCHTLQIGENGSG